MYIYIMIFLYFNFCICSWKIWMRIFLVWNVIIVNMLEKIIVGENMRYIWYIIKVGGVDLFEIFC